MEHLDVHRYLRMPESTRRMELVHGVVREPPAPRYGHQSVVTRLTVLLDAHVRQRQLGEVCVSPVDVVLDERAALVVQPDIVFLSRERLHIVRARIFGAPDLVVEVLSADSARRDRTTKLRWYRRYGVREYWIVAPRAGRIEIRPLTKGAGRMRTYSGHTPMRSTVLPEWNVTAAAVFP